MCCVFVTLLRAQTEARSDCAREDRARTLAAASRRTPPHAAARAVAYRVNSTKRALRPDVKCTCACKAHDGRRGKRCYAQCNHVYRVAARIATAAARASRVSAHNSQHRRAARMHHGTSGPKKACSTFQTQQKCLNRVVFETGKHHFRARRQHDNCARVAAAAAPHAPPQRPEGRG